MLSVENERFSQTIRILSMCFAASHHWALASSRESAQGTGGVFLKRAKEGKEEYFMLTAAATSGLLSAPAVEIERFFQTIRIQSKCFAASHFQDIT